MSENRNHFTVTPMKNLKQAQRRAKRPAGPPHPSSMSGTGAAMRSFTLLQLMLVILLPIFFLIAVFSGKNILFLTFAGASLLCLLTTWSLSAFLPMARVYLTLFHVALVIIALFPPLLNPPTITPEKERTQENNLQSVFNRQSSASMVDMIGRQEAAGPTFTPNPGHASFAQQKLEKFMSAWTNVNYEEMAEYCLPSWIALQDDAATAMFHLRANRSPVTYEILEVTGNDSDQSRTINMTITIDKNNGSMPLTHRFQVIMIRVNNEWYVDPNSLGSLGVIKTEEQILAETLSTIIPTEKPDAGTLLYYNPNGGKLYHKDPICQSLKPEYLPMTASFRYAQVNDAQFQGLNPCGTCSAPGR